MNFARVVTTAFTAAIATVLTYAFIFIQPVLADTQSKHSARRIQVYSLSQSYWDTKSGETLSEIIQQLLPYNQGMQQRLMHTIIELNPNAFIDNNPNRMQANTRLWLPNNMIKTDTRVDLTHFSVQSFSWGNIKRPRR